MSGATADNVDAAEVARFSALASRWWDPTGPSRPLHELNDCRLDFITTRARSPLGSVLDVGCGGGILSEALARHARATTGIDMSGELIGIARAHAAGQGLAIHYEASTAEAFATRTAGGFDCVVCMELLEHVPEPASLVQALATLVKPGGDIFLSTLNRTPRAWLEAVVGAEYLLGLLPVGTHDYRRFLRPAETSALLRAAGLTVREISGMRYLPWEKRARLCRAPDVNYLVHARRE